MISYKLIVLNIKMNVFLFVSHILQYMRADEVEDISVYERDLHEPIRSFPEIAELAHKTLTSLQGRVTSVSICPTVT